MAIRFDRRLGTVVRYANVAIESDRLNKLNKYAKSKGKSVSDVLRERVVDWIDKLPARETA